MSPQPLSRAAFTTRSQSVGWRTTRTARTTAHVWRAVGFGRTEWPSASDERRFRILAYQPDGDCHCLYDPGLAEPIELDTAQRELVAVADWVCLTIGPAGVTRAALEAARPVARSFGPSRSMRARFPQTLQRPSPRGRISSRSAVARPSSWPKPDQRARKSDLKSSLRRAVARASRFRKAGAKLSFQSNRSRRMTRPAPVTRSWAASSRPRF